MSNTVAARFTSALAASRARRHPYPHWLLDQVLPAGLAAEIAGLAIACPQAMLFDGRRESNNSSRIYFNAAARSRFPAVEALSRALQTPMVADTIGGVCGADLRGSRLRIEYCQDSDGFWLEPHTDIGAKRFTMMLYLSSGPDSDDWGTDIYDRQRRWYARAPGFFNSGLIFIPGDHTWHGVERRPIPGMRRSLMINYVGPEWRARHELAFPEQPVQ
ncbi:MAG TPA: 2OG-Fe(II) oxygenase [Rhodospirillaceae bacterium]|nr:2OG-Fe(II) oxygenase [Rhodospirillaceae bacterium]